MFAASSLLFVPGSRPDRFGKAADAGADCVVIDLEDAVAQADKAAAREAALAHISGEGGAAFALRINGVATAQGLADILALKAAGVAPLALFVPMVESAAELAIVARVLADPAIALVPLIETTAGLRAAPEIAAAPQVVALMFGGGDLAGELGVELAWEPLLMARSLVVMAAAGARVPAIDVPFLALADGEGLEAETARAKALGFAAKAAIHPAQVPVIKKAMQPSAADIAAAEAAIAAYEAGGRRAIRHQGRMLEAPIIRRHERVLAAGRMEANA
jgi:citrate lyase beta subunit